MDAMSVFAITAHVAKPPAERFLLSHVQWLRELLDLKVIKYLLWLDTRDIDSDGLTKWKVSRAALHEIMRVISRLRHACMSWT